MPPTLDVAAMAGPYEIIRAAIAALGIIAISLMLDDNIRSWKAIRRAVLLGRVVAWSSDYWIAFANLVGCMLNCVAWVLLAAGATIAMLTPPPAPDRELVADGSNVILILVEMVFAAVQIWQIVTRRIVRRKRQRATAAQKGI